MELSFLGAAHEVTGSCHYLKACGLHILVDCGMQQGPDEYENQEIPVNPAEIDYVLLTHAHIDHSGRLPLLYAKGFRGTVIATEASVDLCGIMLRDTQTGLRAIPASCLAAFSGISGGRYEYETNMLLYCKRHHIPMVEIPISTIYIDDNAGSHYHPVLDSLRIGLTLCRYFLTSTASLLAGLVVFEYFMLCASFVPLPPLPWIWLGLVSAYLVSGLIGFSAHHTDASQSEIDAQRESIRYTAVTALQCFLSGLLLSVLDTFFPAVPLLLAKAAADCILFPCFSRLQDHIAFSQALAEVRRVPVLK